MFHRHHSVQVSYPVPALISSPAPVLESLAQVPENIPFYGDMATLQQIAGGSSAVQVHQSNDLRNSWRLIKHGGQVYVQAHTLPMTEKQIKTPGGQIKLYNNDNAGDLAGVHYADITLPLKSLHWADSQNTDEGWGEITVSQVHPDAHVWENW